MLNVTIGTEGAHLSLLVHIRGFLRFFATWEIPHSAAGTLANLCS